MTESYGYLCSTLEAPTLLDTEIAAPPADVRTTPVKRGYSVPSGTLNISLTQSRRMTADGTSFSPGYDVLRGKPDTISPAIVSAFEKKLLNCQNKSDIFNGCENLTLQLVMCVEHIAYMEYAGRVWLAPAFRPFILNFKDFCLNFILQSLLC